MSRDDSPTVGTGRRGRNGPIRGRFRGRRSLAPAVLAEHGIPDFTPWVRSAYADRNGKIVGPTNRLRSAERALQDAVVKNVIAELDAKSDSQGQ